MTGVFVPAGTLQAIVELLQREISAIVQTPNVSGQLLELGIIPEGSSSADFAAYIRAEIAKWKRVIEAGGIDRI
jgi:tripartite-type tricarboxylate transporter receptor subunit TctC